MIRIAMLITITMMLSMIMLTTDENPLNLVRRSLMKIMRNLISKRGY